MDPLLLEWIEKAEGDFDTAGREMRARLRPNYNACCFHAQQMAEKYLKAFLYKNNRPVPRIHSLVDLLAMCQQDDQTFGLLRSDLIVLDRYAVSFRYPGESADKVEVRAAYKSAQFVRQFIRSKLNLD